LTEKGKGKVLTDEEFKGFLKLLGRRIRAIRKAKNLSMRHIIIVSGYYDAQWRKYECGGSMNFETLMKIALSLEVSLSQLLGDLGQWPLKSVEEIGSSNVTPEAPSAVTDQME
jgi:transcriptional regulator with XRE-family HTH domain